MEPRRALVTRDLTTVDGELTRGEHVWIVEDLGKGRVLIEIGERRIEVPSDMLVATPVPSPTAQLEALDSCFSRGRSALREVHVDEERLFRVLECEHGNLFLEDTITGIGWYSRLIFMGVTARAEEAYTDFWQRHHHLTDDQIRLLGIGG